MSAILAALDGHKTYIIAVLIGLSAAAKFLGYDVPEWAWMLLNAVGLGAVRSGVAKAQNPDAPGASLAVSDRSTL